MHISKLGRGKRINNVEDVLTLGQEIEVRVDDIDDKGKVSLSPVGDGPEPPAGGSSSAPRESSGSSNNGGPVTVSFDDAFDSEIAGELGDLGPGGSAGGEGGDRDDRGGRGGDRRGGRDRGPRRHR